jgi:methylaspartate ammonia-lyase
LRIETALVVPSWGGFFNEDLAAVTSGLPVRDGFSYLGDPVTPGFKTIRTPTEAGSILLVLSDGQVATGDCLSVQYAGAGGRSPRFTHETQISALVEVCEYLRELEIGAFLPMCRALEAQPFSDEPNRTAAFYGVSQALLGAVAASQGLTGAEVLASELGREVAERPIPIYVQTGEDRHDGVDKAIIRRADVMPHGLINRLQLVGEKGEALQDYVSWIVTRLKKYGADDYCPEIHLDAYGLLGRAFGLDAGRIASYLADLAERVAPLQFCMETPVLMDDRAGQIEMFAAIRSELEAIGSSAMLIVDEWANDIGDIRAFVEAGAAHMINVKSPDLGSLHHAAHAVLECKAGHVRPILGGSCNDSDISGRAMCHVALATEPAWVLARPGMGMDEGFQIVHNEMARTLALVGTRKLSSAVSKPL